MRPSEASPVLPSVYREGVRKNCLSMEAANLLGAAMLHSLMEIPACDPCLQNCALCMRCLSVRIPCTQEDNSEPDDRLPTDGATGSTERPVEGLPLIYL